MRKAILLALGLALVAGTAGADAEKIVYHGPAVTLTTAGSSFFANGISLGNTVASPYANLYGEAANTLALRNGGTAGAAVPQTFNIYNFCDGAACATGYENGTLAWAGSVFYIGTQKAGTGATRLVAFLVGNGTVAYASATAIYPGTTDTPTLGTSANLWQSAYVSRSIQGSKSKSLTDAAAAVSFVRIAVPTNGNIGGKVIYTATSTDGTDMLTRFGEWSFAGADTAGTVTCGVGTEYGVATAYRRANTLVCTMTAVTATTNCDLQITCTDDKAAAQTVTFYWRLDMPIPATVTPQ